jgi:uncharacterized protein YceK
VYGGVMRDVEMGRQCFADAVGPDRKQGFLDNLVGGTYFLAVDLPLSAVGDTLTLPITVRAYWQLRQEAAKEQGTSLEDEDHTPRDRSVARSNADSH